MENFIEITVNGKPQMINLATIQCIEKHPEQGSIIHYTNGHCSITRTDMEYDEIIKLIKK